jgi:UV DNA damage endonuclease
MFRRKRMRLGLCCIFREEDIQFKSRQAGHIKKLSLEEQLARLSVSVLHNASALMQALEYCSGHDIGCFRVNSRILPLKSHPDLHYELHSLPDYELISEMLEACRAYSRTQNIRITFHPDQFTLLSSPREEVTAQSLEELKYHAEIAELIGADVITLHGGGANGDKKTARARLVENVKELPESVRSRLALENDDRVYTPADLLPVCSATGLPLVYDVHHHRCLSDDLTIEDVTGLAVKTWNREPLFHISSPKYGWQAKDIKSHHDFIDARDMPQDWRNLEITVEVEAKAKEIAILKLQRDLAGTVKAV